MNIKITPCPTKKQQCVYVEKFEINFIKSAFIMYVKLLEEDKNEVRKIFTKENTTGKYGFIYYYYPNIPRLCHFIHKQLVNWSFVL